MVWPRLWTLASAGFEFVAPDEVRDEAIAAVEKALELDENPPDAHQARALIAIDGEWDLDKAKRHFERALELRPGYAAAHNKPVTIQIQLTGDLEEGIRHATSTRQGGLFSSNC
jgi:tetratricopeptide (TPR) repeat protein